MPLYRAFAGSNGERYTIFAAGESSRNLVHLSILLFVPLLVGLVSVISNAVNFSFLLFPPLAAGRTCSLPILKATTSLYYGTPPGQRPLHATSAAFAMFLTGATTWASDIEEPAAFSTALLAVRSSRRSFVLGLLGQKEPVEGFEPSA